VRDRFLMKDKDKELCGKCCSHSPESANVRDQCFADIQRAISRFLAEDEGFMRLLVQWYEETKAVFKLLDNTIDNFKVLPQADWQVIQHQIDFIRAKLAGFDGELDFHCQHINREIRERSERF